MQKRKAFPGTDALRLKLHRRPACSGAAVGDDEICRDPHQEAGAEQVEAELGVSVAPYAIPDLADDVQDGAAGQGEEQQLQRVAGDLVSDDRSDERGSAADE